MYITKTVILSVHQNFFYGKKSTNSVLNRIRESYTRGPPCAARYRCAASRCRASPYGNIYQKTASQASLHAAFRQIFPHGSTFAHFFKNPLAFSGNTRYNTSCCDMIAVKREVAAARQVFPWSECQEAGTLPGRET